MNVRIVSGIVSSVMLAGTIVLAPGAVAAPKKPGLYGPTEVVAGQEVEYTSVFAVLPTKGKRSCFAPIFTFSDAPPPSRVTIWNCVAGGDVVVWPKPKRPKKPKPTIEIDAESHVFTAPGTYTIRVVAAGIPSLQVFGPSDGRDEPAGADDRPRGPDPELVKVKGPRSYSLEVTVTANPVAPASTAGQ